MVIKSFDDIKNVFYINLEHRLDRKIHTEKELEKMNLKNVRFDAIKDNDGYMGCTKSHIGCLEFAIKNKYDHILILEDDVSFLNPELFISQFNKFINTHEKWDVILFAGNNIEMYKEKDDTSVKINKCHTTTAYLVNGSYIDVLLDNFKNTLIMRNAIDVGWFELQKKDDWYLIIPLSIVQIESYSDIIKKNVNHESTMLQLKF